MAKKENLQDVSEVVKNPKPKTQKCGRCKGEGKITRPVQGTSTCPTCAGSGEVKVL
jgi:DnaJ-class molecular chaperone